MPNELDEVPPDKVVEHLRDMKRQCCDTQQFEAAMQFEMMARAVEQLIQKASVLEDLNSGVRVVLPKTVEHAKAMALVASNYLKLG